MLRSSTLFLGLVLLCGFTAHAEDAFKSASGWAFQKLTSPAVPVVQQSGRVQTPIDAFICEKQEAQQIGLSPEAERAVLARRVWFDLLGLPPTPDELAAFLADTRVDAYERLVDKLLASPHYGERWGRHWLDAAGYADTISTDNNINGPKIREGMWRYRDYVVQAFNSDKPYDVFLTEQLAGDELVGYCGGDLNPESLSAETKERLIATGLLRTGLDGTYNFERNRPLERHQLLYDTIENLSSNLLGLTMACARCHDHKFDPITQADYYSFMACLTPSYNPDAWLQPQFRHLNDSTAAEKEAIRLHNAEIDKRLGEIGGKLGTLRRGYEQRLLESKYQALPEAVREDLRKALSTGEGQRTEVQKYLVEKLGLSVRVTGEEVTAALGPEDRVIADEWEGQTADLRAQRREVGKIQALWEVATAPATYIQKRGNHEAPGEEVPPALPAVLAGTEEFGPIDHYTRGTTGRRLALARGLTRADSPAAGLVARVLVNRLWHHHFGRGIVATPGNFGESGAGATHPELLDWLAAEFIRGGWKIKAMHRLILTSSVYRQASQASNSAHDLSLQADPGNHLLWRMPLRRLESEVIRDATLAVSGDLDRCVGGAPVPLFGREDGTVVVARRGLPTPTSAARRSLYLLARRNFNLSLLAVFDQPLMATNCTLRTHSAVVSQSLALLNDSFVVEQAEHFATRVLAAAPTTAEQIDLAFRRALCRPPTPAEMEWSRELLQHHAGLYAATTSPVALVSEAGTSTAAAEAARQALAQLCRMLLNTNEFLYIE